MEDADIFYCDLVYFAAIWANFAANWYIYWPLGTFCVICNIFPRFGVLLLKKSGNPGFWRAEYSSKIDRSAPSEFRKHATIHLIQNKTDPAYPSQGDQMRF
jgi:hypothetical protein